MNRDVGHIFKAYDIRGKVGSELNRELSLDIGRAFADWLPTEGPVAVGRDMRPDSAELAESLIQGLRTQGREVWDIGQVTSDMSYFAVGKYNLAGAAMITASHNPGEYNGVKFYRDQVIAVGLDSGLDVLRDNVLAGNIRPEAATAGEVTQKDITEDWIAHCLTFVGDRIKPLNVAIDCANGMAGAILPYLEPKLPLKVTRLYYELDGTFPNHEANPMKPENMQDLIKAVKDGGLDLGIAFDGDGDRAGFVDDQGRIVSGSDLISLVAKYYVEKYPGAEIVHEVRTSRATKELIEQWGGKPFRTKAGRVSIGTVMRERGAPFGGETTGHLFFKDNYYADSGLIGALVALAVLSESGKKLSELVDEYHWYVTIPETNFEVHDKDTALKLIAEAFKDGEQDTLDGLTVEYVDSWFNLRASNTEPVMRLNAEAESQRVLDDLVNKISGILTGATS